MAKKTCIICNKDIGLLSFHANLSDGTVCSKCLKSAGIHVWANSKEFSSSAFLPLYSSRKAMVDSFAPDKKIGTYMQIDNAHKVFCVGGECFDFRNLLSFELLEDGATVTKGGLGGAIVGGVLFGAAGAIVGGVTSKKSKGVCNSMKIRLTLKDSFKDTTFVNIIIAETKTNSFAYRTAQTSAQECISALQLIADHNDTAAGAAVSGADEIMKYKQLLDAGIITQDEFDTKKRQLLGL